MFRAGCSFGVFDSRPGGSWLGKAGARLHIMHMSQALETPVTKPAKTYVCKTMKSPVGRLKLVASDQGLAAILWENDDPKRVRLNIVGEEKRHPVLLETERQLDEYFAGKRRKFDVKLDFAGTDFQKKVWRAL